AALNENATAAGWKNKPSWFLVSEHDHAISPDAERFMAQRMGATTETIDGSHTAFIAKPVAVAAFIPHALRGPPRPGCGPGSPGEQAACRLPKQGSWCRASLQVRDSNLRLREWGGGRMPVRRVIGPTRCRVRECGVPVQNVRRLPLEVRHYRAFPAAMSRTGNHPDLRPSPEPPRNSPSPFYLLTL